jgi:hypothetical protein
MTTSAKISDPSDWDSYGAGPMSAIAIDNAIKLVDERERLGCSVEAVLPTCDESILIRYARDGKGHKWEFSGDGGIAKVDWEFFNDGDNVRVIMTHEGKDREYREVRANEIQGHLPSFRLAGFSHGQATAIAEAVRFLRRVRTLVNCNNSNRKRATPSRALKGRWPRSNSRRRGWLRAPTGVAPRPLDQPRGTP